MGTFMRYRYLTELPTWGRGSITVDISGKNENNGKDKKGEDKGKKKKERRCQQNGKVKR
jgi:hypothetical protein